MLWLQVTFSAGQVVWQERDPSNCQFFIIRDGSASLKDAGTGAVTSKLGPGKYFGQQSLVGSSKCSKRSRLMGSVHHQGGVLQLQMSCKSGSCSKTCNNWQP